MTTLIAASNPAGGAVEPQHFAYIIQWYLFAILALAAPLAMARAERREAEVERAELGLESGRTPSASPTTPASPADGSAHERSTPQPSAAAERAAKLADRYGRPVR